jgi:sacsin
MLLSCVVVCVQASAAVAELRQEAQRRESELEAARSSWQCRVCFSRDVEQAFVGCGHMYCGDCMPSLPKCPVCRKTSQKIRLFR